jgi:hypothetical protein
LVFCRRRYYRRNSSRGGNMSTITRAQRLALKRVWLRDVNARSLMDYRTFRRRAQVGSWGCIMIQPRDGGIWLGIEPDGYTHS